MKPLLIQQASGEPYESMLELTRPIHQAYCRSHGFSYLTLFGHLAEPRTPHWNKISLILNAMDNLVEEIIWLDADCLIVDSLVKLTDGIPIDIGMAVHRKWEPHHFNSGAIYIRASDESFQFFHSVWENWSPNPVTWKDQPWNDQSEIMKVNDEQNLITEIDDRWNSTEGINPSPNPIVASLHGWKSPDKLAMMEKEIHKWYPDTRPEWPDPERN